MRHIISIAILVLELAAACGPVKKTGDDARASFVDCTTAQADQLATEFGPVVQQVIAKARDGSGKVDWDTVRGSLSSFGVRTGACVVADLIGGILSGKRTLTGVELAKEDARAGFEKLRTELWRGARFKTYAGDI